MFCGPRGRIAKELHGIQYKIKTVEHGGCMESYTCSSHVFYYSVFPDPPGGGVLSVKSMYKIDSAISAKSGLVDALKCNQVPGPSAL